MSAAKSKEEVAFELMRFLHPYDESDREKILQLYSRCLAIVKDRSGGRNLSDNCKERIGVTLEEYLGARRRPSAFPRPTRILAGAQFRMGMRV
jgi:hypothetical protein